MKIKYTLRFQNDYVFEPYDQAWFSDDEGTTLFYYPYDVWVGMGRPQELEIEVSK